MLAAAGHDTEDIKKERRWSYSAVEKPERANGVSMARKIVEEDTLP
jgi:hypothetical protein